ncbi:MAG TPA: ATP-binding protein, partial [Planctomycetaceae bacterium]|nr:ATP-binding protein [Planctomycetaceae bacterium]
MGTATLLVVQGYEPGARFEVGDQPVQIGRGPQNEIRLLDTEVSRSHASLQRVRDEIVITDRNSSNGTFVNGKLIRSQPLVSGDQIQIGRTVLLYAESAAASDSRDLAQHVRLLQQHDPADRSSIISQIAPETIREPLPAGVADVAQQLANLQVLYRLSEEAVQPSLPLEQLLQRILDLALKAVGADRGCVLVVDPQDGEIRPQAVSGAVSNNPSGRMPISRSIVDYVLKMGQGVQCSDARHDRRFDTAESIVQAGIREAMCVPLPGRNELLGVIYVDTTTPSDQALLGGKPSRFQEDQLRLLLAIGRQAALAIENNRFQQAFIKAERLAAMGQTIATLSHHIKNILQGVRGGSYLIDMGLKDHNEELVRKGWGIVEKNQNKIYHMVMDMLTFSKERQPALQRANVNETVHDVFELMQSRAAECKVELRYEPDPQVPDCTFDPDGIHRAVLNIVTNAIDAVEGADHAAVLIQTGHSPENETVWVAVTDNGPGIPEDHLARIFNLFESTKGARGTGLGLAVSQK